MRYILFLILFQPVVYITIFTSSGKASPDWIAHKANVHEEAYPYVIVLEGSTDNLITEDTVLAEQWDKIDTLRLPLNDTVLTIDANKLWRLRIENKK